jgi:hypothetical protein
MERFKNFYETFILEAALTKNNIEKFNKAFGTNLTDKEIEPIFNRFEVAKNRLTNKDIFTYGNLDELTKALAPTPKEIKAITNSRDANRNGVFKLRTDKLQKIYDLLRITYGYELLDEDLVDIVEGFNEMIIDNSATKNIFEYSNISELKQEITNSRNAGGSSNIDEDPEEGNSKKLYSDESLMVYKIESYEDSMRLCHDVGKSGSWCISYKQDKQYWDSYTGERNLDFIFVIMRNGDKYAIATDKTGANIEIYDTADLLTSGYYLVKQNPQIVEPIRAAGYTAFKSAEQYDATQKDGYTEVKEVYSGDMGSGSAINVTSRIDENGNYLDEDKHGTYGMVFSR